MADERMPYQVIDEMAAARSKWSDKKVLAELASIPPLADESDPRWGSQDYWQNVAYPYLALWQVAGMRRLRAAIPLMLDRACYGDPGEIMRNLCHALEGIVAPNYGELSEPCLPAAQSSRAGTRLWAIFQLMRLREPRAIPIFEQALKDPAEMVREDAQKGLEVLREFQSNAEELPIAKLKKSARRK